MKEHVQKPGVRKWAGEDLIELQGESLTAIQALVEPYAPCIIQGCEVSHADGVYRVLPGIVALNGSNEDGKACAKIVRFEGYTGAVMPIYLTIKVTPYMRVYADEENKPIAYEYTAESSTTVPDIPYLMINASGAERLVDAMGITQKLDREGGNASNVKVVSFVTDTSENLSNIEAGSTLKELFGKIRRWLNDLGKLAFKSEVGQSDFDEALKTAFSNKVDKVNGKGLSQEDFTTALKDKLDKIANNANNYTHPNSAAGVKTSGLYKITTDANGHITAATLVKKEDITALGIPGQDTNTVYTHPTTAGNKHIPSGGSSGQYLKYKSSGEAQWTTPTAAEIGAAPSTHSHNAATQSLAGYMSAADKKKLDNIIEGANKTIVDTAINATSTNPVQNKVVKTELDKKAPIASPTFTGTPKSVTPVSTDNSTNIATTAFVKNNMVSILDGNYRSSNLDAKPGMGYNLMQNTTIRFPILTDDEIKKCQHAVIQNTGIHTVTLDVKNSSCTTILFYDHSNTIKITTNNDVIIQNGSYYFHIYWYNKEKLIIEAFRNEAGSSTSKGILKC